jgi:hypothetical protein
MQKEEIKQAIIMTHNIIFSANLPELSWPPTAANPTMNPLSITS